MGLNCYAQDRDSEEPATAAKIVLTKYCAECHTSSGDAGIDYITDLAKLVERKKVVPKQTGQSRILQRMLDSNPDARMPPPYASEPLMTPDDIATIKRWVEAGAPSEGTDTTIQDPPRSPISTRDKLQYIHDFFKRIPKEDRVYQRFFTLEHLHNLAAKDFSASQLRSVRAATSKVLNSLSWKPDMVLPRPIDASETLLVFDLRDMDWDAAHSATKIDFWQYLLEGYPYGITYENFPDDDRMRELASEVYQMSGTNLPMVRADWFVANASRPPY